jgi:transposase-like protein
LKKGGIAVENKPHYICEKCGRTITKEEVLTGCKACSSKTMSRYECIKQFSVENMAKMIALIALSATGKPINETVKKSYIKQLTQWLKSGVSDNGKE